ncbi:hypothetical protein D9M70_640730 [compost metagenome]
MQIDFAAISLSAQARLIFMLIYLAPLELRQLSIRKVFIAVSCHRALCSLVHTPKLLNLQRNTTNPSLSV